MSSRINPTLSQRKRLLEKNSNVCCVCKERGLGLQLHHIDSDNSNTVDENLAVLCARDHDQHHRPKAYNSTYCSELSPLQILEYKNSWESFVSEAKKPNPKIIAMINAYGTEEQVHSMRLILQWEDGKVEFERIYHLLDGAYEDWIDNLIEEINWLGKGITIVSPKELQEIEYCPNCKKAYSSVLDNNMAKKITSKDWEKKSLASIYINPISPSVALILSYEDEVLYSGNLHKCGDALHYISDNFEERFKIPKRAVRTQATRIVNNIIDDWNPAYVFIGTGNPDSPELIDDLYLPKIWENKRKFIKSKK